MKQAVALLSGGLDSAVAMAMWMAQDGNDICHAVHFDYGQKSAQKEKEHSLRLANRFGAAWKSTKLPWLKVEAGVAGSAIVIPKKPIPQRTPENPGNADTAAEVWVPARNLVFIAIAAVIAEAHGATQIITGFNHEEGKTFPDNSQPFINSVDQTLSLGMMHPATLYVPTQQWDKKDIAAKAKAIGLKKDDVWSCYDGNQQPCGTCESCCRSTIAWGKDGS